MEKTKYRPLDEVINYIYEIKHELDSIRSENIKYIGISILEEICKRSVNVECRYALSNKSPILYNLEKNDLEELIGRTFLGVVPYFRYYPSRIPTDHLRHLKSKIESIIEEFPYYKKAKESKIEIENKLGEVYQAIGSEILRILKESNMIEIIGTSPVHVKILDNAYNFMAEYEEYNTTELNELKIMEYD